MSELRLKYGHAVEVSRIGEVSGNSTSVQTEHFSNARVTWDDQTVSFHKFKLDVSPNDRVGLAFDAVQLLAEANVTTNRYYWHGSSRGPGIALFIAFTLSVGLALAGLLVMQFSAALGLLFFIPLVAVVIVLMRARAKAKSNGVRGEEVGKRLLRQE